MKKKGKITEAEILRQKAEDWLKKNPYKAVPNISKADALKLIHELEVYQIELKMQNEELALAKEQAAEVADAKYTELYDFAPSGYYTLSREGKIDMLNLSGATLLGKERSVLINCIFSLFISNDTKPVFNIFLEKVFKNRTKQSCEVTLSVKDNLPVFVLLNGIISYNSNLCLITAVDITGLKSAEEVLSQSENRLQNEVKERTLELENLNLAIKSELVKRITSQKQLKETLQDYKQLYSYLQKVREEERLNIARIIHDDLAQLLSTMKIELISWKERPEKQVFLNHDPLNSLLLLVDQSMNAITSIINELRPVLPDKMGLIPALSKLFNEFQKRTGILCDIRIQEETFLINSESASAIYQVVQEGLTNIRNHSRASYVSVKISCTPTAFTITIKDNGIGVSPEKINDHGSFGIIGMKERVAQMKGKITFKGVEGKGTVVFLKVPASKELNN